MTEIEPGLVYVHSYLNEAGQKVLLAAIREVIAAAPLFVPAMPRTGKPLSVRMTNCGDLGWVTDAVGGYRYQAVHPETDAPWPKIPELALDAWQELGAYAAPPQ